MKFEKYQHVERLGTPATDGILDVGKWIYLFPKLDGTNTSVYLDDNGKIEVASRNRALSEFKDNYGVRHYVYQNRDRFEKYFAKYPNRRLFGEWLVPHTIRDYLPDAWHKLYIFDVMENGKYIRYEDYYKDLQDCGIDFIELFTIFAPPVKIETVMSLTKYEDFLMQGGKLGEGIVIKNYDFVNRFGETVWAKVVRERNNPPKKSALTSIDSESVETKIIDSFLAPELIDKEFQKIAADGWSSKLIGKFIGTTWKVFIDEETFNFLRAHHNPKIDFKLLHKLAVQKIKNVKSDIFR